MRFVSLVLSRPFGYISSFVCSGGGFGFFKGGGKKETNKERSSLFSPPSSSRPVIFFFFTKKKKTPKPKQQAVPLDLPKDANDAKVSSSAAAGPRKALRGDGKGSAFSKASPGAVAVAVGIPLLCVAAIVSSALVWRASAQAEKRRLAAVAAASAAAAKGQNGGGMEWQPTWGETVFADSAAPSSSSLSAASVKGAREYSYPPPPAISQPSPIPPHMFPSATAVPLAFAPTRGGDATAAAASAAAGASTTSSASPRLFGGSGPSTPRSRRARGGFFGSGGQ